MGFILFFLQFLFTEALSQDVPPVAEQQLENLADAEQTEPEDDSYLQQLEHYRRNPLNLNEADASELRELRMLTDLQMANLLTYRRILGKLVSIYELQAIPSLDLSTIKKMLPFVTLQNFISLKDDLTSRFKR